MLDAPCGGGRIAVRLAERGLDVTGVDISAPELEIARSVAAERGVAVRFQQRDIRELPAGEFAALGAGATASATCLTQGPSTI